MKKASPKLLREDLRKLPGNFITNDEGDESKIHELDPPHVVAALASEQQAAEEAEAEPDKKEPRYRSLVTLGQKTKFTGISKDKVQFEVDLIRMRIIQSLIGRALANGKLGLPADLEVKYVWFPTNNLNHYEMRQGNPPSRHSRPGYLRGIDLELDVLEPPKRMRDIAAEYGTELFSLSEALLNEQSKKVFHVDL